MDDGDLRPLLGVPGGTRATLVQFSSAFCAPCRATRTVLARAALLVPAVRVVEVDVAREPARAQAAGVRSTPTVVVRDDGGAEVFRAVGVPTLPQVLLALDRAAGPGAPSAAGAGGVARAARRPSGS